MGFFKKYSVLLGVLISIFLLLVATLQYPGGSMFDKSSVGFDWSKNFISNLFLEKALNGLNNPARLWADAGMIFLALSFALFFINFSKKIPAKGPSRIIKYVGAGGMVFTFLIVTPQHDLMITLSSTLFLISLFYITVFILKSRLLFFKFLCVICLLIFYYNLYLFGSGPYTLLPLMQKITFISTLILILCLQYFTKKEDFESGRKNELSQPSHNN